MTTHQIELVKKSWCQVVPMAQEAGELFYKNLFEAAPGIRHLFKTETKDQAKKLVTMLAVVISELGNLDSIINDVKRLAKRHDRYGAQPEHYAVVGEALIKTLKMKLDSKWTEEIEQAWIAAYTILSGAMIEAQNESVAAL